MTQALDDRIVQVGFVVGGQEKIYSGMWIQAEGTLFANPNQDECKIKIANLDKATRDYIATVGGPFTQPSIQKQINLYVGRQSYGKFLLFTGDIVKVVPSQPPDLIMDIKAQTGNFVKLKGVSRNAQKNMPLSGLAKQVAADLGVNLRFEATDRTVNSYSHVGSSLRQVDKLGECGEVDAYLSGNVLVIKNVGVPLQNTAQILNADTGLIGVPEPTERGVKLKFLIDNKTVLGGQIILQSQVYPALNGNYAIYKLSFDIASRETPFYYIAECLRI